jgi:hypothetical protein
VSVVVIARFSVSDIAGVAEWVKANAAIPEEITAYGKSMGQLGHRIVTDHKDLIVIDEWPDKETFNKFFETAPRMQEFLDGSGITGDPEILMLDSLDLPGTFWS